MRTYTKVARADAEERTKTALTDAATRAFFEDDWTATSLQSIASEAGVTKQTLLRHFGSKEGLANAAFDRAMRDAVEHRFAVEPGDLEGAVDTLIEHYEAMGDRALKLEALHGDSEFVKAGREFHYAWIDRVFGAVGQRRRAALIAVCDVHTWRLLSEHLALPRREVRATLLLAIRGVLA